MHTDRGSQYASHRYQSLLESYGMTASMSRSANAWDNAVMESFFKTLKVECVREKRYPGIRAAKLDMMYWIDGIYNHNRIHSSLGFQTPNETERTMKNLAS